MTKRREAMKAKPFVKWAGGKGQLIPAVEAALPEELGDQESLVYVEPFVGSGAVLFWFLQKFPNVRQAIINDINADLINAYSIVKKQPMLLIEALQAIQDKYYGLKSEECRRNFFSEKRDVFNSGSLSVLDKTALLFFLNRTCFNGLYRVNSQNRFNVPFGKYSRPKICDPETILADSSILQKVTILNGDYRKTMEHASGSAFFYIDPPYRAISKTSSFNAYAREAFGDDEQIALKQFCDGLSARGYRWLLSNSDPKNKDPGDNFFDDLYKGESLYIKRVKAKRTINANAAKRGEIMELLISNYRIGD